MNQVDQIIQKIRAGQYALFNSKHDPLRQMVSSVNAKGQVSRTWVAVREFSPNTIRAVKAKLIFVHCEAYGCMSYIHPEDKHSLRSTEAAA